MLKGEDMIDGIANKIRATHLLRGRLRCESTPSSAFIFKKIFNIGCGQAGAKDWPFHLPVMLCGNVTHVTMRGLC